MASISEHLIGLPIAADGKPAAPLAPTEAGAGAVFGAWCSGSIGPTCFMGPLDVPGFFLLLMPFLLSSSHFHPLKEQPRRNVKHIFTAYIYRIVNDLLYIISHEICLYVCLQCATSSRSPIAPLTCLIRHHRLDWSSWGHPELGRHQAPRIATVLSG